MVEQNKRGAVRKKPDPMALKTRGRVTTYEAKEIPGISTKPVQKSATATLTSKIPQTKLSNAIPYSVIVKPIPRMVLQNKMAKTQLISR